jgi:hypothetical protein
MGMVLKKACGFHIFLKALPSTSLIRRAKLATFYEYFNTLNYFIKVYAGFPSPFGRRWLSERDG